MKRTTSNKILIAALTAVSISGIVSSCQKYNNWPVDDSTNRLFSTTALTANVDGVTASLNWKEMPSTNGYVIELSKDSLQFGQIIKTYTNPTVTDSAGLNFVIPDLLDPNTQYSARVKGTDTSGTPDSKWTAVAFKTKTEQIMYVVTATDKTFSSVILKWKVPNAVTHFMMDNVKYDISASESETGVKTITGLKAKTNYTAVLYYNASIRGQQAFTTPANVPTGSNVVMVGASDSLNNLLKIAVPGTIFVLSEGTKYNCDYTVALPEGASFTIWGEEGVNKPVIAFNGFSLPSNAGTIQFENVNITGYQDNDPAKTKRDYIFNQDMASNTGKVVFENCAIHDFNNTPFRIKGASVIIDSLIFNRCVGYNSGLGTNYSFIHNSVATSQIKNIKISNSTIYNIGYGLLFHNVSPSQSVLLQNSTFNNITNDTKYFIDYNTQAVAYFLLENIIVGKTYSPAGTAKGIRAATVPVVINSYKTKDAAFAGNQIPLITDYLYPSTDLFTDPTNGIFTFKDNSFEGKSDIGDPQWRP